MARTQRRTSRLAGLVLGGGVLIAVFILASLGAVLLGWSPFKTETVDRSAPVVLKELQDVSRYKAATGEFSELIDLEKDVRFVPDFMAGERTVLVAVGSVDAEVDFSRLDPRAITVSDDGKRVEVHLPAAVLAAPSLDMTRTHVATRSRGLANRVGEALTSNAKDDAELYQRATDQIAAAAAGTELRSRAEANTRTMLEGLLGAAGYAEVVVVFDDVVPT